MAQPQSRSSAGDQTRYRLLLAAEGLFAESGIDSVSLRQVNVAARQKNSSAAHYHFGSKDALILSICRYRMSRVNRRRVAALDEIEHCGDAENLRQLVGAFVQPIVQEIDADAAGRNYIRFMAQAIGHPQLDLLELWQQEHNEGLRRLLELLRSALPDIPEPIFGQRFGLAFEQTIHSLADREKLRQSTKKTFTVDSALFVNNLIDCVTGAISAPLSEQTRADWIRLNESKPR